MRTVTPAQPLTFASSPIFPPCVSVEALSHADWTVPRQDDYSPFPPSVCHLGCKGDRTHAGLDLRETAVACSRHALRTPSHRSEDGVKHFFMMTSFSLHMLVSCRLELWCEIARSFVPRCRPSCLLSFHIRDRHVFGCGHSFVQLF